MTSNGTAEWTWKDVHNDLENNHFVGRYGGDNAAYHGLAGVRAGVDMHKFHSKRSPDEFYVPELEELLKNPQTSRHWDNIVTMDPEGMFATRPTASATTACMTIPELMINNMMDIDGVVVNKEDKSINCVKLAVDWVWNIPALAKRLKMDETAMRKALADSTQNPHIMDPQYKTYLPPVGGCTVYFIGDIRRLNDKNTEVAVRVHDECCGSDVFGTDICTCRPYLIFALQACVQTAQRGGVGIIIYFRKEGRSLGEVTKFRVYNARTHQEGGDRPEMYFAQTEAIAGIRDARFQEMMPDVLLWLGIDRIDWLLSMSADKYDAIVGAGIDVLQRVGLPDMWVPENARVEITAKISAGYHSETISQDEIANELRGLPMIRERCGQIFERAKQNKLKHFSLHLDNLEKCVEFVAETTRKNYPDVSKIPYHSRWRHFDENKVKSLVDAWPCDEVEKVRRMIDLATVSVFLDAGAGTSWHYRDAQDKIHERSEGLAIATFDMFADGTFSSDQALPYRVNSLGLKNLSLKNFSRGLQITESNTLTGLEGRYKLMRRLGKALYSHPEFFAPEQIVDGTHKTENGACRPGGIVDYILRNVKNGRVSIKTLWRAVIEGFETIWPDNLSGVRRGDVWVYSPLKIIGKAASDMIPFHKLSQWLTYSLLEPLQRLGIQFDDLELMTGLPEYRNGGLFVDMEVIKPKHVLKKEYDVGSELVVEWRALTVCLLDLTWEKMCEKLNLTKQQLPLASVLQGGTWAAGRLVAASKRADRSAPINIRLDGTVF